TAIFSTNSPFLSTKLAFSSLNWIFPIYICHRFHLNCLKTKTCIFQIPHIMTNSIHPNQVNAAPRSLPKLFVSLSVLFWAFVFVSDVSAQTTLWTNPITGNSINSTSPYVIGQTIADNITVSGISRGGVNALTAND